MQDWPIKKCTEGKTHLKTQSAPKNVQHDCDRHPTEKNMNTKKITLLHQKPMKRHKKPARDETWDNSTRHFAFRQWKNQIDSKRLPVTKQLKHLSPKFDLKKIIRRKWCHVPCLVVVLDPSWLTACMPRSTGERWSYCDVHDASGCIFPLATPSGNFRNCPPFIESFNIFKRGLRASGINAIDVQRATSLELLAHGDWAARAPELFAAPNTEGGSPAKTGRRGFCKRWEKKHFLPLVLCHHLIFHDPIGFGSTVHGKISAILPWPLHRQNSQ